MRWMEALVRASDLDWTILRPSGLSHLRLSRARVRAGRSCQETWDEGAAQVLQEAGSAVRKPALTHRLMLAALPYSGESR